jgi:hypothetical protein
MGQLFATAVLVISGLFFLLTTWSSATAPHAFAARLGLAVADAGGVNEVRAQYAGFFLAAALACGGALAGWLPRHAAFAVVIVIFGGLIGGRLVSLAIDGGLAGYGPTIRALHAIDAVGCALLSRRLPWTRRRRDLSLSNRARSEKGLSDLDDRLAHHLALDQHAIGVGSALHREAVRDVRAHDAERRKPRQLRRVVAREIA